MYLKRLIRIKRLRKGENCVYYDICMQSMYVKQTKNNRFVATWST